MKHSTAVITLCSITAASAGHYDLFKRDAVTYNGDFYKPLQYNGDFYEPIKTARFNDFSRPSPVHFNQIHHQPHPYDYNQLQPQKLHQNHFQQQPQSSYYSPHHQYPLPSPQYHPQQSRFIFNQFVESYAAQQSYQDQRSTHHKKSSTLLNIITTPTPVKKVKKSVKHLKMSKSEALKMLMKIAGDDWDSLNTLNNDDSDDECTCPASEGHYASPSSCSVYYQCAQGRAHRRSCGAGLSYNILSNQCDWSQNVQCHL